MYLFLYPFTLLRVFLIWWERIKVNKNLQNICNNFLINLGIAKKKKLCCIVMQCFAWVQRTYWKTRGPKDYQGRQISMHREKLCMFVCKAMSFFFKKLQIKAPIVFFFKCKENKKTPSGTLAVHLSCKIHNSAARDCCQLDLFTGLKNMHTIHLPLGHNKGSNYTPW